MWARMAALVWLCVVLGTLALPGGASARSMYLTDFGDNNYANGGIVRMAIGSDGALTQGYRRLKRALSNGAKLTARVTAAVSSGSLTDSAKRSVRLVSSGHHH